MRLTVERLLIVQSGDIANDLRDLGVVQWRAAPSSVPGEQELQRDLGIDAMPKQVASQRSYGGIALAFRYAILDQLSPVTH